MAGTDEEVEGQWLLLIDSCGAVASVALVFDGALQSEQVLAERSSSRALLSAIRSLLAEAKLTPALLAAVGVVAGPGSFTGVRVGMATAQGLSEATGRPLVAVSRLAVLSAASGLREGFAVLDAGRRQLYVREERAGREAAPERMVELTELCEMAGTDEVVYAEPSLREPLQGVSAMREIALSAAASLPLVLAALRGEGGRPSAGDANYVRDETEIYRRVQGARPG